MAKKKTDLSETRELLEQAIDKRTKWGKQALAAIDGYYASGNTIMISLLRGLAMEFPGRPLVEILDVDPADYQKNVRSKCVCGRAISDKVYRMDLRSRSVAGGVESQIIAKIKAKKSVKTQTPSSKTEFFLGSDHYTHFQDLLTDLGEDRVPKIIRQGRKKKQQELEDLVHQLSDENIAAILKTGLSLEQFGLVADLVKELPELTKEGMLYGLDPGRKNSFANWFREGIAEGTIDNQEILDIFDRLTNVAHLVTTEELAALTTYSYEFRKYDTRAVIGGIKSDLTYLADLPDDHELVRQFGKPNLDKNYVRPATRFRSRKGLEKVTIREKLEQSHLSFLEALGIKLHFPDIERTRLEANRIFSQRYSIGREFHNLLQDIKVVFEQEKDNLHSEFKQFGEIVAEHALTKTEYNLVKGFLERARMGRRSERENYLRMYSIKSFRAVMPKMVVVGRKLRVAEKYNADEDKLKVLRQEYVPIEDTEIDAGLVDMLAHTGFIENKNLLKFQQEHAQDIAANYEQGLVAQRYIARTGKQKQTAFERYAKSLEKEDVVELDDQTRERLEEVVAFFKKPYVIPSQEFISAEENTKYIPRKLHLLINAAYEQMEGVKDDVQYTEAEEDELAKIKDLLPKVNRGILIDVSNGQLVTDPLTGTSATRWSPSFTHYSADAMRRLIPKLNKGQEASEDLYRKCLEIGRFANLQLIGTEHNGNYFSYFVQLAKENEANPKKTNYTFFLTPKARDKVEEVYARLEKAKSQ